MRIKVRYMGVLRDKIGRKEVEYVLSEDQPKLSDLIRKIIDIHGEGIKRLFESDKSSIDPSFIITINGVAVNRLRGLNSPLKDGDIVSIMSLISGG